MREEIKRKRTRKEEDARKGGGLTKKKKTKAIKVAAREATNVAKKLNLLE